MCPTKTLYTEIIIKPQGGPMLLSNEQLKSIYFGALRFEETQDGYLQTYQYDEKQMDYFRNSPVTFWYDRSFATSAKTFEMTTTATRISFHTTEAISRNSISPRDRARMTATED